MSSYTITNGEQTASKDYSSSADVSASFSAVNAIATTVTAIDSRGLKTTVTKELGQISYSAPVLATATAKRDNDIDPTVKLTLTGLVFAGSFGAQDNAITITWRWKRVTSDTWSDGVTTITPTISDTGELTYSGYIVNAADTWYIEQAYDLEINISDKIATGTPIYCTINVGVPGIYMTKTGDQYSVGVGKKPDTQYTLDVNGTIHDADGTVPSIVEQGTSSIWTYRKWSDGTAECWGRQNYGSMELTWQYGGLYYRDAAEISYPFTFAEVPQVQVTRTYPSTGGLIIPIPAGQSASAISFYIASSTSSTYTVSVAIYAFGKWK